MVATTSLRAQLRPQRNTSWVSLDPERLSDIAERAAGALKAEIYGVDAVVPSSGEVVIIDMNDWPTFARFRREAG